MRRLIGVIAVVCAALPATVLASTATAVDPQHDWSAYLHDPGHSSYAASETAITPDNAAELGVAWRQGSEKSTLPGQPPYAQFASPTVADGAIFFGNNNGYFYKLDLATGAVLAKTFLGYTAHLTCNSHGVISTATVAVDPTDGADTLYVAAADGYLYALRPSDLTVKWQALVDLPSDKVNDYFNWASPTVANGRIYLGSSSSCDQPLTRGAVVAFDQTTGEELGRYFTVPEGMVGGGVWTSVAVADDGTVYSSTGTQIPDTTDRFESVSIVRLDGTTLAPMGTFTVPDAELGNDGDFGGSPVVFGDLVGACNKNSIFYALDRFTMKLKWQKQIGGNVRGAPQCLAAAVYDGQYLYLAAGPTTIDGTAYAGSVRRVDPETGEVLWATGLPNFVRGTPSLNGGGVLAVGTSDVTTTPNAIYLLDASTGEILRTLEPGGKDFGQPVFAQGYLVTANIANGLSAYRLMPSVTGFSPATGRPGTKVTVAGLRLAGATKVTFGTVDAAFTVVSPTQLTVTVPASAPAAAPLSVVTPEGTGVSSTAFKVPPSIQSFIPAKGTAGTVVTVTGSGFTGANKVAIGGVAQPFVVDSQTQLHLTVDAQAPGSARIVVTTPGGTAKTATLMKVAPLIDSFTPKSGTRGTSVVLTGRNFRGATKVMFGTINAASYVVNSPTRITAKVPAGVPARVHLKVVTTGGSAVSAATFNR